MDIDKIELGQYVYVAEPDRYYRPACKVVAIQRRRYRAEIQWPRDGARSWHPVRVLRIAVDVSDVVA